MGIIGTRFVAVVTQTNCHLVVAVWLPIGLIPNDIILPINAGPNRNSHLCHACRCKNIGHNNIEITVSIVNILDRNLGTDTCLRNGNSCFGLSHSHQAAIFLLEVGMNMVNTRMIFVISSFNSYLVGSIGLFNRCVPLNIILAIHIRPDWYLHRLQSFWSHDTRNNDVKTSHHLILIAKGHIPSCIPFWKGKFRTGNPFSLSIFIVKIEVNLVVSTTILMILTIHSQMIIAICLLGGCIPANIILTTCLCPNWNLHMLNLRSKNSF